MEDAGCETGRSLETIAMLQESYSALNLSAQNEEQKTSVEESQPAQQLIPVACSPTLESFRVFLQEGRDSIIVNEGQYESDPAAT